MRHWSQTDCSQMRMFPSPNQGVSTHLALQCLRKHWWVLSFFLWLTVLCFIWKNYMLLLSQKRCFCFFFYSATIMSSKKSPVLRRRGKVLLCSDPGSVYLHILHFVHFIRHWHVCDMPIEAEPFTWCCPSKQLMLETMIKPSVWQTGEVTYKLQVDSI